MGVFRTHSFLKQYTQTDTINTLFTSSKKKDDLADSLLQALSYVNLDVNCDTESFAKEEKIICRKPSKKQERSRYSKCNLKWILNEYIKEGYTKEVILSKIALETKVVSAVKYWFKTSEEAFDTLTNV